MAHEVVVPEVGEYGMEVTFVRWLKSEGDQVQEGEPLFELDTDKSTMEVEAFTEGRLANQSVVAGDMVEPRQVVATLAPLDEELPEEAGRSPSPAGEGPGESEPETATAVTEGEHRDAMRERAARASASANSRRASPKAKRLARERGVDLSQITGSGADGLITERDVVTDVAPAERDHSEITARSERVRQAVAEMTTSSWQTTPHFHLSLEADVTEGLKHTKPTALICVAIAQSLVQHPEYNLTWEGERPVRRSSVDLGILVDMPAGLLLPTVHGAESLDFERMAEAIAEAAARAREGRLAPDDYGARSITVSNLGMFPVDQFTGVIPASEILLLGAGRVRTVPRWDGQGWVPRQVTNLTLTGDHRALSGADAGRLLGTLEAFLADPGGNND